MKGQDLYDLLDEQDRQADKIGKTLWAHHPLYFNITCRCLYCRHPPS